MGRSHRNGSHGTETLGWIEDDPVTIEGLRHVTELAVAAIAPADHASIMLVVDGALHTVASSDDLARDVDQTQILAGDGPSFLALRRGDASRDACTSRSHPSAASIRIDHDEVAHGVLNLYSTGAAVFGVDELRLGRSVAAQAAAIIRTGSSSWAAQQLTAHLSAALAGRAVIEQAKGIIIAAMGCSADEAFAVLSRQSQHENRKLREVAEELVESKVGRRPSAVR